MAIPRRVSAFETPPSPDPEIQEALRKLERALASVEPPKEGSTSSRTTERPVVGAQQADVERARSRAVARAATRESRVPTPDGSPIPAGLADQSILDKSAKDSAAISGAVLGLTTGTFVALYAGYGTSLAIGAGTVGGAYLLRNKALSLVDWMGSKLDSLGKSMIDKNIPIFGALIIDPINSVIDRASRALSLDKSFADKLKEDKEARKKLAEKLLKEFQASEKKHEKTVDDAKKKKVLEAQKKKAREETLSKVYGRKNAKVLVAEIDDLEAEEAEEAEEKKAA